MTLITYNPNLNSITNDILNLFDVDCYEIVSTLRLESLRRVFKMFNYKKFL